MKKRIKVIVSLLLSFTVIFSFNICAFAGENIEVKNQQDQLEEDVEDLQEEIKEVPKEEVPKEEVPKEEVPKDEATKEEEKIEENLENNNEDEKDENKEKENKENKDKDKEDNNEDKDKDKDNDKDKDVINPVPTPEPEKTSDPVPEIKIETLLVSLEAEVTTARDEYISGETINYSIVLRNTGDTAIEHIGVSDSLGLTDSLLLLPGEIILLEEKYIIPVDNMVEELENIILISALSGEEAIDLSMNFKVKTEPLKGSIIIRVNESENSNQEFDVFITGPNNSKYTVSLMGGESQKIDNLPQGDYTISTINPMNYTSIGETSITINSNKLHYDETFKYTQNNKRWFYSEDSVQVHDDPVINISNNSVSRLAGSDKRYDSVAFNIEIEVLIYPEVPVEQTEPIEPVVPNETEPTTETETPVNPEPEKPKEEVDTELPIEPEDSIKPEEPKDSEKPEEPKDSVKPEEQKEVTEPKEPEISLIPISEENDDKQDD